MPGRVSPNIYASVFNRNPDADPKEPNAMPPHSKVATRGGAYVPTAGHWAEPPLRGHAASVPATSAMDTAYKMQLMEAQLRSEERMRKATLAMAADRLAATSLGSASGAHTARF